MGGMPGVVYLSGCMGGMQGVYLSGCMGGMLGVYYTSQGVWEACRVCTTLSSWVWEACRVYYSLFLGMGGMLRRVLSSFPWSGGMLRRVLSSLPWVFFPVSLLVDSSRLVLASPVSLLVLLPTALRPVPP